MTDLEKAWKEVRESKNSFEASMKERRKELDEAIKRLDASEPVPEIIQKNISKEIDECFKEINELLKHF